MFNKFALVITGLMLTVSSVGCCCLHGSGYGTGYGMRGGCAPCNNGCSPAGGTYYPPAQGAYYQGMDATSTAMVPTMQTVVAPTTTALAPIQGAPIYNQAVLPGSTLPLY